METDRTAGEPPKGTPPTEPSPDAQAPAETAPSHDPEILRLLKQLEANQAQPPADDAPAATPETTAPEPAKGPVGDELAEKLAKLEESNAAQAQRLASASKAMTRQLLEQHRVIGKYERLFSVDNPGFDPFADDAAEKVAIWAKENAEVVRPTAQETAPDLPDLNDALKDLPNADIFSGQDLNAAIADSVRSARKAFGSLGVH